MKEEPAQGAPADDPKAIVKELAADWARLGLAGEVTGLVDLYSENAIFFGSLPHMFFGHTGVAEYFRAISLTSLKAVEFAWQQARYIAPSVISAGGLVYFGMDVEGTPVSWRFGINWVLVKSEHGWKIAAHHASPREL